MITPNLVAWAAALLEHPTTGLNATRLLVPRGTLPAPPAVAVFDVVADSDVARRAPPDPTPSEWVLYCNTGESMVLAGSPMDDTQKDEAILVFHLAGATASSNNAAALASAALIMRALRRVLFQAFRAIQASNAGRLTIDQQQFHPPADIQLRTLKPEPGSGRVDLIAIAPFSVTDHWT